MNEKRRREQNREQKEVYKKRREGKIGSIKGNRKDQEEKKVTD